MYRVVKQIDFCYGHRLLDYEGKCAHPHGHNALIEIVLEGDELDHRGMLLDFVDVKKVVKEFVDHELDHLMILNRKDPLVPVLQEMNEPLYLLDENPTAENIAKVIFKHAQQKNLPVKEVRLWETASSYAVYGE